MVNSWGIIHQRVHKTILIIIGFEIPEESKINSWEQNRLSYRLRCFTRSDGNVCLI